MDDEGETVFFPIGLRDHKPAGYNDAEDASVAHLTFGPHWQPVSKPNVGCATL